MNVYVASSWRNERQPEVVRMLRAAGHTVYDFRNPEPGDTGFQWSAIDPEWETWTPEQFRDALNNSIAAQGRWNDEQALKKSNAVVLVTPCGRSAHLELGWGIGAEKFTAILLDEKPQEPELMYGSATRICLDLAELVEELRLAHDTYRTSWRPA